MRFHKRAMIGLVTGTLVAAGMVGVQTLPAQAKVNGVGMTIYQHGNFGGLNQWIDWEDDCLAGDRWQFGFDMNDTISGIKTSGSNSTRYYEHCHRGGRSRALGGNQNWDMAGDSWWNDTISSWYRE